MNHQPVATIPWQQPRSCAHARRSGLFSRLVMRSDHLERAAGVEPARQGLEDLLTTSVMLAIPFRVGPTAGIEPASRLYQRRVVTMTTQSAVVEVRRIELPSLVCRTRALPLSYTPVAPNDASEPPRAYGSMLAPPAQRCRSSASMLKRNMDTFPSWSRRGSNPCSRHAMAMSSRWTTTPWRLSFALAFATESVSVSHS